MKKVILILTLIIAGVIIFLLLRMNWNNGSFADNLAFKLENISKIELSLPDNNDYRSAQDSERIQMMLHYLKGHEYKQIRGEPTELPMSASTLYLYEQDKRHSIIMFGDKMMVDQTFYKVTDKPIDLNHLKHIYQSLD